MNAPNRILRISNGTAEVLLDEDLAVVGRSAMGPSEKSSDSGLLAPCKPEDEPLLDQTDEA